MSGSFWLRCDPHTPIHPDSGDEVWGTDTFKTCLLTARSAQCIPEIQIQKRTPQPWPEAETPFNGGMETTFATMKTPCLCATGSCSVDIAWALSPRRVNGETPAGSIFLGQSPGGGHGCLLQTAEQVALLGLASAKSPWHALPWLASFPYVRPMICPLFNDSSLAAGIKTPALSLPHGAQRFLLA